MTYSKLEEGRVHPVASGYGRTHTPYRAATHRSPRGHSPSPPCPQETPSACHLSRLASPCSEARGPSGIADWAEIHGEPWRICLGLTKAMGAEPIHGTAALRPCSDQDAGSAIGRRGASIGRAYRPRIPRPWVMWRWT